MTLADSRVAPVIVTNPSVFIQGDIPVRLDSFSTESNSCARAPSIFGECLSSVVSRLTADDPDPIRSDRGFLDDSGLIADNQDHSRS